MIPHIQLKAGAGFPVLKPAGIRILNALDDAAQTLSLTLTITSGSEGTWRSATDPHRTGEAVDISVRGLELEQILRLHRFLTGRLGPLFTVLYERADLPTHPSSAVQAEWRAITYINAKATAPHFHVQRKRGTHWPPTTPREVRA